MGDHAKVLREARRVAVGSAEYLAALEAAIAALSPTPQPVTPAGGEVVYQMMAKDSYVNGDGHEVHDDPKLWMDAAKDEYERLRNHPSVRTRILYTRPPVADAALVRDAERWRMLKQLDGTVAWRTKHDAHSTGISQDYGNLDAAMDAAIQDAALNQRGGGV